MKTNGKRTSAIKNQIKVRKILLAQPVEDQSVFAFSANKKQHSLTKLKENLFKLVDGPASTDPDVVKVREILGDPRILVGKFVTHMWTDEQDNDSWFEGQIESYHVDSNEFKIHYFHTNEEIYLSISEIITDLRCGDLVVLW